MTAPEFSVIVSGDSVKGGPLAIRDGDLNEPVLDAITRAYELAHGTPELGQFQIGLLGWDPTDDSGDSLLVRLDLEVTVERFLDAFGPIVTGQPATAVITVDGIGGDSYFADLIGEPFKFYKVVKGIFSIADGVRFQENRREIVRWQDSGVITMRLRQLVLAESAWDPVEFTRQFNIEGSERGGLLRSLGYAAETRSGRKVWVEVDPG